MPKIRLLRLGFWCIVAAVLFLALMPSGEFTPGLPNDKINHFLAFFVLACGARLLWARPGGVVLFVLLSCFGGAIELLQLAMGLGRQAEWGDLAADVLGVVAGLLFARVLLAFGIRRVLAD